MKKLLWGLLSLWSLYVLSSARADVADSRISRRHDSARLIRYNPPHYYNPEGSPPRSGSNVWDHPTRRQQPKIYVWSSWAPWSHCSRTCGGGVRIRARICRVSDHRIPPTGRDTGSRFTYRACLGDSEEYDMCETTPCPTSRDYRAEQCAAYNGRSIAGNVQGWQPKINAENACELICKADNSHFTFSFGKVKDGTRCDDDETSVCVNGRCIPLGCDGKIGSRVRMDACARCGGRNTTCVRHQNVSYFHLDVPASDQPAGQPRFRSSFFVGHKYVVKLPRGATSIRVHDDSPNSIVLRVTNEKFVIDEPGTYPLGGTTFRYRRSAEDGKETLSALGPINTDMDVLVLLQDVQNDKGVYYEYWAPIPPRRRPRPTTPPTTTTTRRTTTRRYYYTLPDANLTRPWTTTTSSTTPRYQQIDFPSYHVSTNELTAPKKPRKKCKTACPRATRKEKNNRRMHFCKSEFVVRAKILFSEEVDDDIRYRVQIVQSYKNMMWLQSQEYVWSKGPCQCPKLVIGKEYILTLRSDPNYRKKEHRLVLTTDRFAWTYSDNVVRKILRVREKQDKACRKYKTRV